MKLGHMMTAPVELMIAVVCGLPQGQLAVDWRTILQYQSLSAMIDISHIVTTHFSLAKD